MPRDTVATAVGVALIVFGVLLIIGEFTVQKLLPFAGLVLLIFGILVLVKVVPGGTLVGVVVLIIGVLLLEGLVELPLPQNASRTFFRVLNLVAGVILLALGVSKVNER